MLLHCARAIAEPGLRRAHRYLVYSSFGQQRRVQVTCNKRSALPQRRHSNGSDFDDDMAWIESSCKGHLALLDSWGLETRALGYDLKFVGT